MHSFLNDYSELAHPSILEAMTRANLQPEPGYYTDSHSGTARELIRRELGVGEECEIHFMTGGTVTNLVAVTAFLRPHQAVIAARSAHVATHETGAIEAGGHKVITVDAADGKVTPALVREVLDEHGGEHMVEPAMVVISDATELGTVYTRAELTSLRAFCLDRGLLLYCDGARLGSAVTSTHGDVSLPDLVATTDAFSIGGTKNGALVGEALVVTRPELAKGLRHITKQRGGLLAKGAVIGIQFEELFREGLFFDLASHANRMAAELHAGLADRGCEFLVAAESNQLFPILTEQQIGELEKRFQFLRWARVDGDRSVIRLVTSWATRPASVQAFVAALPG